MQKHYPPSGKTPDITAFAAPQYCSWTVFLWSRNQQKILDYARSIVKNGFKPGILIIDDTWQKDYGVKEARCLYKLANKPIIYRLNDKKHVWKSTPKGELGLSSLIPCILTQGLVGYVFGCPDMVGGGLSCDFIDKSGLDDELIVRWCQASALLPMVQFSLDVWNRKQNRVAEICKKTMDLREKLTPYIVEKLTEAGKSGVPAVRYLEYEYPSSGYNGITDEFMLGEKYLVAPVLEKGADKRKVVFPAGKWKDILSGEVYLGGVFEVSAPIDKLPVFEKIG